MDDWIWGIIVALAAIGGTVIGEVLRIWRSRVETKETRRRDATSAALEIMKMALNNDDERKHLIAHYDMAYKAIKKIFRAPEK